MSEAEARKIAEALAKIGWARWCDVPTIARELREKINRDAATPVNV